MDIRAKLVSEQGVDLRYAPVQQIPFTKQLGSSETASANGDAACLDADGFDARNLYVSLTRGAKSLTIVSRDKIITPRKR